MPTGYIYWKANISAAKKLAFAMKKEAANAHVN